MFALILDSLGSTELLFILVIALIFFGPRKLPQLSRSLGKGLAEFRKASEDFKQTWEKEVALESARNPSDAGDPTRVEVATDIDDQPELLQPAIEPVSPERVIARSSTGQPKVSEGQSPSSEFTSDSPQPGPGRKQDWL